MMIFTRLWSALKRWTTKTWRIIAMVVIVLIALLWLCFTDGGKPHATGIENANKALDRVKDWTTWMAGLQTAALATIAALCKKDKGPISLSPMQQNPAFFALLFLGLSIILSTWILSSLPSIQLRLPEAKSDQGFSAMNDIYIQPLYTEVPFKLGPLTGITHTYCLLGFIFFAIFLHRTMTGAGETQPNATNLACPRKYHIT
jgi:hypothetical protein